MKIGIDFGNSLARVAYLNEQGIPEIIPDFEDPSVKATSSIIHIGQRGCLIGERVEELLEVEPALSVAKSIRSHLRDGANPYIDEYGKSYDYTQLTALLFRKLVQDAEKATSEKVEGAVITIPNHFGKDLRDSISEAASITGIACINFADPAIAVAHHYGLTKSKRNQFALVFDIGSTGFCATVISSGTEELKIVDASESAQGASLLDEKIETLLIENYRFSHGVDLGSDPVGRVQIRHFANAIKQDLSHPGAEEVRKSRLVCGRPLEIYLSSRQISRMIEDFLSSMIETTEDALKKASLKAADLDVVFLNGGNCRLDVVRRHLGSAAGIPLERIVMDQPDFAEVFGAAHLTKTLKLVEKKFAAKPGASAQVLGKDLVVCSLSPGSREEHAQVIINRDSPLPARREIRCVTSRTGQRELCFQWALQGDNGQKRIPLGESIFSDLPGEHKGYPIDLAISVESDGMIEITFSDPETGRSESQTLEYEERRLAIQKSRIAESLQTLPINQ